MDDPFDFDPFRLFKRFEKMFSDLDDKKEVKKFVREPLVDISETENNIKVVIELPGVEKKDIDLEIKDNYLIIRATIKKGKIKTQSKDYLYQERNYQQYYRVIPLPKEVDNKSIDAKYNNGILEIILKKKKITKHSKVLIK